jgi:predicted enzyme related to lactoylglutathione lyase
MPLGWEHEQRLSLGCREPAEVGPGAAEEDHPPPRPGCGYTGIPAACAATTKGAPMLRGLTTVSYWAADLAAAKQWYAELLGIDPYFERPVAGPPAYVEFRLGDYQHELGLIDSRYAPHGSPAGPAGAVVYWHVDDVTATLERLLSMGAKEHEAPTDRGEGSSPLRWSTRSGTSWASCTTRTTWRFWARPDQRDPRRRATGLRAMRG